MKRALITSFLLVSTCAAAASAENLDGNVTLGGSYAYIHGQKAKANEYRTLGEGMFGGLDLDYRDKNVYTNLQGSLIIIDGNSGAQDTNHDVNMALKGGVTDSFKANLFYNEMPHNFTFGARTFVNGIGTPTLVKPTPGSNPTAASYTNSFDYAIKKKNMGMGGEISLKSPFFFAVQADRSTTTGLMPFALGTALREYPAPIDYTTNNVYLQTGYRSNNVIFTVDGLISSFSNEYDRFSAWYSTSSTNYGYLPPDNNYYKVGGSLMYKIPSFLNSTLMARANYSMLRNDVTLSEPVTFATAQNWGGKVNYTTASAALTSNPTKNLDTRIFINFLNKKNEGPEDFNYGTGSYTTERFDYSKRNIGVNAGYKLPAKTKLNAGYEYLNLHRTIRTDAPSTNDHTFNVQAKNDALDWLSAKVSYQRLMRTSDFQDASLYANDPQSEVNVAALTSSYYKTFFRPADTADKDQDTIKAGIEIEPMHGLSIGTEYIYKKEKYTKNVLGMQNADRNEIYFDVNYANDRLKLNAYADLEMVESNATYRQMPGIGGATALMPVYYNVAVNDANNFNWTSKRKDLNYALGANGEVTLVKNLLKASLNYRFEQANGSNDFASNPANVNVGASYRSGNYTIYPVNGLPTTNAVDDYSKQTANVKLNFMLSKNVNFDLGYLFEHLKYSDDAYAGYKLISGTNYLSGAYASQSYDLSVIYTAMNVKF